jgi:hypothetical protein
MAGLALGLGSVDRPRRRATIAVPLRSLPPNALRWRKDPSHPGGNGLLCALGSRYNFGGIGFVHGRRSARYVSLEGQDVSGAFPGSLTHRGRNASMWQSAHLPALPVVVPAGGGGRCLFHELRVDLSRHRVAGIAVMRSIERTQKWAVS